MQKLRAYLTREGWKKDFSETLNDFASIYHKIIGKTERNSENFQSDSDWIKEQMAPFDALLGELESLLNSIPQKLPQKIVDRIHIDGRHIDEAGNTYEIWGKSIARYGARAGFMETKPSALFDFKTGQLIQIYRREEKQK